MIYILHAECKTSSEDMVVVKMHEKKQDLYRQQEERGREKEEREREREREREMQTEIC